MKLVKLRRDNATAEGVLYGDRVRILGNWRDSSSDAEGFSLPGLSLEQINRALDASREEVAPSAVSFAIPMDRLRQIICVGVNYHDHAHEIKTNAPTNPLIFTRSFESLVAHNEPILCPSVSVTFDYEGEIAIVIGRNGRNIASADAMSYVAAYTCFLDGSVREYQKHSLTAGKNFWRSGAIGPWLVTADEVGTTDLILETHLNGQTVQSAELSQMIFSIPDIVSYCSRVTWLRAGDVIATGTPGGVGSRRTPPLWMKPGDRVEVEVTGVGRLSNPVAADE